VDAMVPTRESVLHPVRIMERSKPRLPDAVFVDPDLRLARQPALPAGACPGRREPAAVTRSDRTAFVLAACNPGAEHPSIPVRQRLQGAQHHRSQLDAVPLRIDLTQRQPGPAAFQIDIPPVEADRLVRAAPHADEEHHQGPQVERRPLHQCGRLFRHQELNARFVHLGEFQSRPLAHLAADGELGDGVELANKGAHTMRAARGDQNLAHPVDGRLVNLAQLGALPIFQQRCDKFFRVLAALLKLEIAGDRPEKVATACFPKMLA
jgi:hypothetical protein